MTFIENPRVVPICDSPGRPATMRTGKLSE